MDDVDAAARHVVATGVPCGAIQRFHANLAGNAWWRHLTPEELRDLEARVSALRTFHQNADQRDQ
jgi:hypothetical protein